MDRQIEILNRLVEIMAESADIGYELLSCKFTVDAEEESVGQEFSFLKKGRSISAYLNDPDWIITDLVLELQKLIKSHTGGQWVSFVLTVGTDGKAKTNFEY